VNKLKGQKIEESTPHSENKTSVRKPDGKNTARSFIKLLNGEFLTRKMVMQMLPFVLFLSFIAILYISNTYYAEKTIRNINSLHDELKELKAESITTRADRMFKSKQSEVAKQAAKIDLKESLDPSVKIVAEK
jgi:hypothetical protein